LSIDRRGVRARMLMEKRQMRGLAGVLALLATTVAMSCNSAQPAVNRVQPNAVAKSALVGAWYYRKTVIDVPYSSAITWVGDQGSIGSVDKIVWDIQERYLIARRSYQRVQGSEPEGIAEASAQGAVVAMYAIESHFDIRREYDPVTGEEQNVVSENSVDRPWYKREYMRVDWSQNLVTDWQFLTSAQILGRLQLDPVSYFVQDLERGHPHRPKFEKKPGSDEVYYIDIVNKMFAKPELVDTPEIAHGVPHCFFFHTSFIDCAPVEITVRNSFLKVDEARDYQPKEQTGDRMARAGFFYVDRAGYDPHYGVVESARHRYYVRHNLWQQSHRKTKDNQWIACTAADAQKVCGDGGSVCDLDWGRAHQQRSPQGELQGICTIPYRERVIRPIVTYLSKNFPESLMESAERVVEQWNQALVQTVGSLRQIECRDSGGEESACAAERARPDGQHLFVLCHNPVSRNDGKACGEVGTSAEFGDLRYSLIGWVNEPHRYSPLGYGPHSADPETGEIIASSALLYGAGFEQVVSFGRDVVALLLGDLDEKEVSGGAQVKAWVERQQPPGSAESGRPADDHAIKIDGADLPRINAGMDFSWARGGGLSGAPAASSGARFTERIAATQRALARNGAFGGDSRTSGLDALIGTDIENLLTGSQALLAAGFDPRTTLTDEVLQRASPLRGASPVDRARALQKLREQAGSDGCLLTQEFADVSILGLAREIERAVTEGDGTVTWFGKTYPIADPDGRIDYEAVRSALMIPLISSAAIHEIGHTLGLFHNFSGSHDSLNYQPRYWELRDDGNMAPRAWDALTEDEIDGRIGEYAYSSVMDYAQDVIFGQGNHGLGHYDLAAIKLGYGDLVEVFDEVQDATGIDLVAYQERSGYPVNLTYGALTGANNKFEISAYTYVDVVTQLVGGIGQLEKRSDVPYESLQPDPVLVSQDVTEPMMDAQNRPAVPYRFCNDYLSEVRPECQAYDAGADPYESVQSIIDRYWNYHLFDAYRRERLGFDVDSYQNRILNRYLLKLQRANQVYTLYRGLFEAMYEGNSSLEQFWTRPDGMGDWTAAVGAAYQLLTKIITTPEPGTYERVVRGDGSDALEPVMTLGSVRIDDGDGRPLETTWDVDHGYYYFENIDRVGFYYDKVLALQVMTDPRAYFVAQDTAPDVRKYQINFYSSFGPAVTNFMRGLLAEDWQSIAPRWSDHKLLETDSFDMGLGARPGIAVDPNASFSIQLNAAVFSMIQIPETFDQSYFNSARIFLRGSSESVSFDPSLPVIEFVDPTSGLVYAAGSYLDEQGRETGIGAQMLLHARKLLQNGSQGELARFTDNIDMVRRLTGRLGYLP
jgi:hypothetical protein